LLRSRISCTSTGPALGNELLRVAGRAEELSGLQASESMSWRQRSCTTMRADQASQTVGSTSVLPVWCRQSS
jgi:hypothetical protein